MTPQKAVALIPARSGSRRIPHKNVRPLGGHPLLAYSVAAALESGVFSAVVVSTDSPAYADVARHYGAETVCRPAELAGEHSMDVEWLEHALRVLAEGGRSFDAFSILRPTSPFRGPETIRRAWAEFAADGSADSLRAVERAKQHPAKTWIVEGRRMKPFVAQVPGEPPAHSRQTASLAPVYAQNASLEIARTRVVLETRTIAGTHVMPFFTQGWEGFDVNDAADLKIAEVLVRTGEAVLPSVRQRAFANQAVLR